MKSNEIISILRNPWGHTPVSMQEARLSAADEIERLRGELADLRKAVCIYSREESDELVFERDEDVVVAFICRYSDD